MPKARSNPTQQPRRRVVDEDIAEPAPPSPLERGLAVTVVALAGLAVLGFAATLAYLGFREQTAVFADSAWQYAFWVPLVALPGAMLALIALILASAARKARDR